MRACPKYRRCSAPKCPLDPLEDIRSHFPGEPTCRLEKAERMELAQMVSEEELPRRGMTVMEWAATLRERRKKRSTKRARIAQGAISGIS